MTPLTRSSLCAAFLALISAGAMTLTPADASAFCGFYVSSGDAALFNDATQVALMRQGTRTVLSMQNNYTGPVKDFAMVIPVPEVLMEADVKTLPPALFAKLDTLSAPRLVEYWEQDPCFVYEDYQATPGGGVDMSAWVDSGSAGPPDPVVVEAEFSVGEYDVVVLSASEGTALESWLTSNSYNIPAGATPIFNQYIQNNMYFFVAKINPAKVTFQAGGKAILSPLRFAFDSQAFDLPIRLGMVNSSGEQDLIVYVLSQEGRYELANYNNVTIPTNKIVAPDTRASFGEFYSLLFADTLAKNPDSVITEYAWDTSSCDPCPGPVLDPQDIATLGADELGDVEVGGNLSFGWTITRLHARYGTEGLDEDLVFKKAQGLIGGNGIPDREGNLLDNTQVVPYGSTFQGRYVMLNPWDGEIACDTPTRGLWGGMTSSVGAAVSPNSGGQSSVPKDRMLESYFADPPSFEPTTPGNNTGNRDMGGTVSDMGDNEGPAQEGEISGSGCTTAAGQGPLSGLLALLGLCLGLGGLRRRRQR